MRSPLYRTLAPIPWLLLAIPLSVLPKAWRRRLTEEHMPWVAATIVACVLQALLALVLGASLYVDYADAHGHQQALETVGRMATQRDVMPGNGPLMGMGSTFFIGFLLGSPGGWLVLFLWAEALFRIGATVALGEPVGSSFLFGAERVVAAFDGWRDRRRLGPARPDRVARLEDGRLRIESCWPRDWNRQTVLSWETEFWELSEHYPGDDASYPFVYVFARSPRSKVIRRLEMYVPWGLTER